MPITWASRHPSGSQSVSISVVKEFGDSVEEADNSTGVRVPLIMRESDTSPAEFHSSASISRSGDLPPARKYERKPPPVKDSTIYKTKRAKNNEAVRRCRANAKKIQDELEDKVICLELENQQLRSALQRKDEEITRLKEMRGLARGLCNMKHIGRDDDMS